MTTGEGFTILTEKKDVKWISREIFRHFSHSTKRKFYEHLHKYTNTLLTEYKDETKFVKNSAQKFKGILARDFTPSLPRIYAS